MSEVTITIEGQMTDLNSYVSACKLHFSEAGRVAKENRESVFYQSLPYQIKVSDMKRPLYFTFKWYVKNRRIDKDNIAFAKKFIFDGFQDAGLIENDGWDTIGSWYDELKVDKENPRVEVTISSNPIFMAYRKLTLEDLDKHPELKEQGYEKFDIIHKDKFKSVVGEDEVSEEQVETDTPKDWSEYTVAELKDELRERDLKVSGNKKQLISRLENNS